MTKLSSLLSVAALVAALLFLPGCASLEAQWDKVWTPDARERAEAKAEELRGELRAYLDTVEETARDELRRLIIDGLGAP